jgi:hypothetical protein
MAQVLVSTTTNVITITQNPTSVSVSNNNSPVTVAQSTADLVEVKTDIGPRGPLGPQGPPASTGSLLSTASITDNIVTFTKGNESTFDITIESSSFTTTASNATTATTATNANNVYVDFATLDTISRIPTFTGVSDGNYQLKSPTNGIIYYQRVGNPVTGESGNHSDYLFIGGGSNTAGGIYLNSTVTRYNFVYSDYNPFYIKAGGGSTGDLHLQAQNDLYLSSSKVIIENLPTSDPGQTGQLYTTGSDLFGGPAGLKVLMVS